MESKDLATMKAIIKDLELSTEAQFFKARHRLAIGCYKQGVRGVELRERLIKEKDQRAASMLGMLKKEQQNVRRQLLRFVDFRQDDERVQMGTRRLHWFLEFLELYVAMWEDPRRHPRSKCGIWNCNLDTWTMFAKDPLFQKEEIMLQIIDEGFEMLGLTKLRYRRIKAEERRKVAEEAASLCAVTEVEALDVAPPSTFKKSFISNLISKQFGLGHVKEDDEGIIMKEFNQLTKAFELKGVVAEAKLENLLDQRKYPYPLMVAILDLVDSVASAAKEWRPLILKSGLGSEVLNGLWDVFLILDQLQKRCFRSSESDLYIVETANLMQREAQQKLKALHNLLSGEAVDHAAEPQMEEFSLEKLQKIVKEDVELTPRVPELAGSAGELGPSQAAEAGPSQAAEVPASLQETVIRFFVELIDYISGLLKTLRLELIDVLGELNAEERPHGGQ